MGVPDILYGALTASLEEVGSAIAAATGLEFELRESSYVGVYLCALGDELEIVTQPTPDDDPMEDDFAGYAVLVYVTVRDLRDLTDLPVGGDVLRRLRYVLEPSLQRSE
ncbi:hypothetical protein [Actinokineospora cianjurensis]|uniref:Uncharacterized protein n=1 Tax=Actinokineospora cianjurensis TaxID=585224 RepID=A0A421AV40_9PSEU|nr:hypothetical protein [Actinokineospora cianjurensis]RLK53606.1 hypothetical protein CLV68_6680 [Actinokineospora cianjurensis]